MAFIALKKNPAKHLLLGPGTICIGSNFWKFFTLLEPGFFGESVLDSFLDWNKFLCFGESVLDSFLDWNKFLCLVKVF